MPARANNRATACVRLQAAPRERDGPLGSTTRRAFSLPTYQFRDTGDLPEANPFTENLPEL